MLEILENELEIFMDVQDLVLQWVFLRSFESRPRLTTFFIEFLSKLLQRYAGANLFGDIEKSLIVLISIQLYITCNRYVKADWFPTLYQLGIQQIGYISYISAIEYNMKDNEILSNYHMDELLDILSIVYSVAPYDIQEIQYNMYTVCNVCVSNMNNNTTAVKCIRILNMIYKAYPTLIDQYISSINNDLMMAVKQYSSGSSGSVTGGVVVINNQVIEEPDTSDDNNNVEYNELSYDQMNQRGMMEGFINNFIRCDDGACMTYIEVMRQWIDNEDMNMLLVENIDVVMKNIILRIQDVCSSVSIDHIDVYVGLVDVLFTVSDRPAIISTIDENTIYEMFDTLLYSLINTNSMRGTYGDDSDEYHLLTKLTSNINTTIINIISICDINNIYSILFDLLIKSRQQYVPNKFDSLVIKCLVKNTQRIDTIEDRSVLDISTLFMKMQCYMSVVNSRQDISRKEDMGIKMIKTILNAVCDKCNQNDILDAYNVSASNTKVEDNSIKKWIKQILQDKQSTKHTDNTRYTENTRFTDNTRYTDNTLHSKDNNVSFSHNNNQYDDDHDDGNDTRQQLIEALDKIRSSTFSIGQLPKIMKEIVGILNDNREMVDDIDSYLYDIKDNIKKVIIKEIHKSIYNTSSISSSIRSTIDHTHNIQQLDDIKNKISYRKKQ